MKPKMGYSYELKKWYCVDTVIRGGAIWHVHGLGYDARQAWFEMQSQIKDLDEKYSASIKELWIFFSIITFLSAGFLQWLAS